LPENITPARPRSARNQVRLWKDFCSNGTYLPPGLVMLSEAKHL
jgi:hypothetical protein